MVLEDCRDCIYLLGVVAPVCSNAKYTHNMKIAFMGPACSGKTTLIQQFLHNWPQYKQSDRTYRDIIKEKNLTINKEGSKESQGLILEALIEELEDAIKCGEENVVFDRCVIDNIAYSLWLYNAGKLPGDFIIDCKYKVRDVVQKYDVIFYVPRSKDIPLEQREGREIDIEYLEATERIFDAIVSSYENSKDIFFPLENCPAVITLNCAPDLRCDLIKLYLKSDGTHYVEEDGSLIYS